MSRFARNGENANSALLVGVTPADFASDSPLAGVEYQRRLEEAAYRLGGGSYRAPAQLAGDFLKKQPTSAFGSVCSKLSARSNARFLGSVPSS